MDSATEKSVVYVCTTCRPAGEDTGARPGADLLKQLGNAIRARGLHERIEVAGVECLSVCSRPVTVAVTSPGKWTFVLGDIEPDRDVSELIECLGLFGRADNGIVPWRARPATLKRVVTRIPPFPGADTKPCEALLAKVKEE